MAVLAAAAGLAHEATIALGRTPDGLAVGDLRLAHVGGDLELAHHAVDEHVEVELAHARDEGLSRLLVVVDAEGGVLFGEPLQGHGQLVLVSLGLGLDGDLDDGLREDHRLEDHGVVDIAEGVAGVGLLEADRGGDVAGSDLVDLLARVGVELDDATDALPLVLARVVDVGAGLELAAVDTEEGQLAHEGIGGDLEGQRREGLLVVDGAGDLVALHVRARDGRHVERAGQVVHDRVEHGLDALVLEGRAREHRHDAVLERAQAQAVANLVGLELLAFEELHGQLVVELGHGLDHGGTVLLGLRQQFSRDLGRSPAWCRGHPGRRWRSSR